VIASVTLPLIRNVRGVAGAREKPKGQKLKEQRSAEDTLSKKDDNNCWTSMRLLSDFANSRSIFAD